MSGNFLRQFRDTGSKQWKTFTATQFMEVWNHFDLDGNGYIEGKEIENFLREFVSSVNSADVGPEVVSDTALAHVRATFMEAFDDNKDEKLDISELQNPEIEIRGPKLEDILPTDESFLLLFRRDNPLESSVEFMRVWREFDKDNSGYIESNELKEFLDHLLKDAKQTVTEERLNEYTKTVLTLFDFNKDGKLQLSEMARLLPVKQNYLTTPILKAAGHITKREIERVFDKYDKDKSGHMEGDELGGFIKDLLELTKTEYSNEEYSVLKNAMLEHWDLNRDKKICRDELSMLLIQQCRLVAHRLGQTYQEQD